MLSDEMQTCDIPKHRKRAPSRKPFTIEARRLTTGQTSAWVRITRRRWATWGVWSRYASAADRDKALAVLNRKNRLWEFRAGEHQPKQQEGKGQ
jgi:hypothetical protein